MFSPTSAAVYLKAGSDLLQSSGHQVAEQCSLDSVSFTSCDFFTEPLNSKEEINPAPLQNYLRALPW